MGNACWWKLKYLETQTSLSSLHNSTKDKKQQMAENLAKDYYCLKHIFIIKKTFFFWLYSVALMHFWYSLSVLFIVVQAHVRRSKLFCKLQMPWHIYAAPTDPFPVFILKSTSMRELLHKMKAGDWSETLLKSSCLIKVNYSWTFFVPVIVLNIAR